MVHELAISTDSHFTVALINVAVFRSSSTSQNVNDFNMRRPLHSDHFLLCCVFNMFSIPPVVPYPLRSPVSWPTEIWPWLLGSMKYLAHLSDEVRIRWGESSHSHRMWGCFGFGIIARPGCCTPPVPPWLALAFGFPPGTSRHLGLPQAKPAHLRGY